MAPAARDRAGQLLGRAVRLAAHLPRGSPGPLLAFARRPGLWPPQAALPTALPVQSRLARSPACWRICPTRDGERERSRAHRQRLGAVSSGWLTKMFIFTFCKYAEKLKNKTNGLFTTTTTNNPPPPPPGLHQLGYNNCCPIATLASSVCVRARVFAASFENCRHGDFSPLHLSVRLLSVETSVLLLVFAILTPTEVQSPSPTASSTHSKGPSPPISPLGS